MGLVLTSFPPSPFTRNFVTDVVTPNPNFAPITLDANLVDLDTRLTQFFGTNGMTVNNIVQNVTNCQAEIFISMKDYIPRAMFRFTNLQLLLAALQTNAASVPDLL